MKAIFREHTQDQNEQKYVMEELSLPQELGPTELKIEVRACGITPYKPCNDILRKATDLQYPVGQEVAGIISQVGSEVSQYQPGDPVAALLPLDSSCSGCANYCIASVYDTVKLPIGVSFAVAAACIGDGVRAYTALHYQGRLTAGDTLMVLNGASNSSILLTQLAVKWGAKVLATSSSKEQRFYLEDSLSSSRLAAVLDVSEHDSGLVSSVMEETGGLGLDVIVDDGVRLFTSEEDMALVGEDWSMSLPHKHDLISCLGAGGRWVTSHHSLQLDPPDCRQLFLRGASVNFLFEHIWGVSAAQYGRLQHMMADLLDLVSNGDLKPHITRRVSMEEALQILPTLNHKQIGKTVMTL